MFVARIAAAAGIACLVTGAMPAQAVMPSFDCKRASTAIEKRICEDEFLSFRDGALGALYSALRSSTVKIPDLDSLVRHWLAERDKVCGKQAGDHDALDACLMRSYATILRTLTRRMMGAKLGAVSKGLPPVAGTFKAKAEGFSGTITVVELPDLSAFVEITTVSGRNAHICQLHTGTAKRTGNTLRWRDADERKCEVTLTVTGGTLKAAATPACRQYYCGANTDFVDFPYKR